MRKLLIPTALFVVLLVTAGASAAPELACKGGQAKTVDVGIARVIGCFTEETKGEEKIYTAKFADQPQGDLDLNGFIVSPVWEGQGAVRINSVKQSVTAIFLDRTGTMPIQLRSHNVPISGSKTAIGGPTKLDFVAPNSGELTLDNLRFGSNDSWARALTGFIPANAEVPVKIGEEGTGTMDLIVEATGKLALEGRPQSASIKVNTASGQGTKLDGFSFSLNAIKVKLITFDNLSGSYSASTKTITGNAEASWDFPRPGGKAGFKVGATLRDGQVRGLTVGLKGLHIPIGTAGIISSMSGGFDLGAPGKDDIDFNIAAGADLGPPLWTPQGGVGARPISANVKLSAGKALGIYYIKASGDVAFMNIPLGDAYISLFSNASMNLGASLGIGLPSVRNNEDDPFYIGGRIDGWISPKGFQFSGRTRFALFGWNVSSAEVLVNHRAIGACAEVLWVDIGAAYVWRQGIDNFGTSCGLGRYRETMSDAVASSSAPRTVAVSDKEVVLHMTGENGAPRPRLVAPNGTTVDAPTETDSVVRQNNAFFVDEASNTTLVVPPRGVSRWRIEPLPGTPAIRSVKAGQQLPPERVRARVVGKGLTRTLVWNSNGGPNTQLVFSEEMPGGREQQVLHTDKVKGRYRFKVGREGNYGARKINVSVIHNDSPRETKTVARYRVNRPALLRAPKRVRASRDMHRVKVSWKGVPGATGYIVTARIAKRFGGPVSISKMVGPKARRTAIGNFPGAAWAHASVVALNADKRAGRPGGHRFRPVPAIKRLKPAAQAGANSASPTRRGTVTVRTVCPTGGHCQVRLALRDKRSKRVVARASYQQPPSTFHRVELRPKNAKLRKRLARGKGRGLRLELHQNRFTGHGKHSGPVR